MRGWKTFSLLAALLLGGCIADASPQEDEPGTEETQQNQGQLLEGEEVAPGPQAQQATPSDRWNPGTAVATTPGGKPQPDPWRNQATQGPNKPQPDPWSPTETQHSTK